MTSPRTTNALRIRTISGLGFQLPVKGALRVVNVLGAAAIVETDVQDPVLVVGCAGHCLLDAMAHLWRELVPPPADQDPHATSMHLVDLPLHRLVEQPHQRANFGPRPRPVFGREGVDREGMHPQVFAGLEDTLDRPDARPMAEAGGPALAAGPTPIAVHDDPDVAGDLRVQS